MSLILEFVLNCLSQKKSLMVQYRSSRRFYAPSRGAKDKSLTEEASQRPTGACWPERGAEVNNWTGRDKIALHREKKKDTAPVSFQAPTGLGI